LKPRKVASWIFEIGQSVPCAANPWTIHGSGARRAERRILLEKDHEGLKEYL